MPRKILLISGLIALFLLGYLDKLAFRYHWYYYHTWSDKPMHFLGGIALGLLGIYVYCLVKKESRLGSWSKKIFLSALLASLIVGVPWEFFEVKFGRHYSLDVSVKTVNAIDEGKGDSATDVISDILGSLEAAIIIILINKKFDNEDSRA